MTELGRHVEKTLNPVLKLTLKATLTWAFKSIPQVWVGSAAAVQGKGRMRHSMLHCARTDPTSACWFGGANTCAGTS